MSRLETVKLGASRRDEETNATLVQAQVPLGDGADDFEPFGEVPVYSALGVTSLPYPSNEKDGAYAEGLVERGVGNANGALVAARDTRTAETTAQMAAGETCVHATGPDFDARTFYKDKVIAHIVKDNFIVTMDGEEEKYLVSGFGLAIEMSRENGIVLEAGGAGITIKDGQVHIRGKVILGGMATSPAQQVCFSPAAGTGTVGAWVVSPNVLVGV